MSGFGPSRHFAAKQRFGRFRREADVKWQVGRLAETRMTHNGPNRETLKPVGSIGPIS